MTNILETFEVTPNTNLLDVLGHSGYSLPAAIADIIDNSITAKAKNIWIDMRYKDTDSYIVICDDGVGMDIDKLKEASTIAFKDMNDIRESGDLGRFSTGINSASNSMCEHLFIQSKVIDANQNTISLDYKVMKSEGWKCYVVDYPTNYIKSLSGTAIIWNNLKTIARGQSKEEFYQNVARVETHLSHVFGDYIRCGLKIYVNGNLVKLWDPFFTSNIKTSCIYEKTETYHESVISVKIYILPPYNNLSNNEQLYMRGYGLSEQQGFYIYRNNRIIKEGGWLGLGDLSISNKYDYARIRVDIDNSLDYLFNPNFLKSDVSVPSDLKDFFVNIAKIARKESHRSFNYMKAPTIMRSVKKNKAIPVWNCKNSSDGLLLAINEEHPIVKNLLEPLCEADKRRLFKLLAKNIPIGEIARSGVSQNQNRYIDIDKELLDMYERLKENALTDDEIMRQMMSCEPFCLSDEYIDKLVQFFIEKGVLK